MFLQIPRHVEAPLLIHIYIERLFLTYYNTLIPSTVQHKPVTRPWE